MERKAKKLAEDHGAVSIVRVPSVSGALSKGEIQVTRQAI